MDSTLTLIVTDTKSIYYYVEVYDDYIYYRSSVDTGCSVRYNNFIIKNNKKYIHQDDYVVNDLSLICVNDRGSDLPNKYRNVSPYDLVFDESFWGDTSLLRDSVIYFYKPFCSNTKSAAK